ncbi:hypothetical protein K435DRAFT_852205 [Dendrothele bispora CBS 962.96]|uniref:Uncharacterized protein n=1 Tax=Dendrothele bispora (strain CBS 962.96) TaxID=1314807 RepID=A0A4S8MK02_DENBC|nr:hypothetical protein K435DRAFT_852205 [Dendrothele bispora CBS 962.96]
MSSLSLAQKIAQQAVQRITSGGPSSTDSPSSTAAPASSQSEAQEELPTDPFGLPPVPRRSLAAFAHNIKQDWDLDPIGCATVDKYLGMSPEERSLFHFAAMLKIHEQVKKKNSAAHYTESESLKASFRYFYSTLRSHALLLFFSPQLTTYTQGKLAEAIIAAAREIGCPELPAPHEIGKLKIIKKSLSRYLTNIRYQVKEKLTVNLRKKKQLDVATLSQALVGEKGVVPMTANLYRRVAVLRFVAINPDCNKSVDIEDDPLGTPTETSDMRVTKLDDNFWTKVDAVTNEWRVVAQGNTAVLLEIFDDTYKKDCSKYGQPAKSGIVAVPYSDVPAHQKIIDKHASKIKYQKPSSKPSRKRNRREVSESSEDETSDGDVESGRNGNGIGTPGNDAQVDDSTEGQ